MLFLCAPCLDGATQLMQTPRENPLSSVCIDVILTMVLLILPPITGDRNNARQ